MDGYPRQLGIDESFSMQRGGAADTLVSPRLPTSCSMASSYTACGIALSSLLIPKHASEHANIWTAFVQFHGVFFTPQTSFHTRSPTNRLSSRLLGFNPPIAAMGPESQCGHRNVIFGRLLYLGIYIPR